MVVGFLVLLVVVVVAAAVVAVVAVVVVVLVLALVLVLGLVLVIYCFFSSFSPFFGFQTCPGQINTGLSIFSLSQTGGIPKKTHLFCKKLRFIYSCFLGVADMSRPSFPPNPSH